VIVERLVHPGLFSLGKQSFDDCAVLLAPTQHTPTNAEVKGLLRVVCSTFFWQGLLHGPGVSQPTRWRCSTSWRRAAGWRPRAWWGRRAEVILNSHNLIKYKDYKKPWTLSR